MTTQSRTRLTYWDYMALPESDERYELIDGELRVVPAPVPNHQGFLGDLHILVHTFVRDNRLGRVYFAPIDVVLSEYNVVQPDLIFVSNERLDIITDRNVRGSPDLVVEVLSPSTNRFDRNVKRECYEKYGVREYWMADIERRTIEVLALVDGEFASLGEYGEGEALESRVLPRLEIDVSGVFESAMI